MSGGVYPWTDIIMNSLPNDKLQGTCYTDQANIMSDLWVTNTIGQVREVLCR